MIPQPVDESFNHPGGNILFVVSGGTVELQHGGTVIESYEVGSYQETLPEGSYVLATASGAPTVKKLS